MKKLSKFFLKDKAEVLDKDEMKLILGGGAYICYCGENTNAWFYYNGDNPNDLCDGRASCTYSTKH